MERFRGIIIGAVLAVLLSVGGVWAGKEVLSYIRDTKAKGGRSVVFDFLGSFNATNRASFVFGTNATLRSKTTGNSALVGYEGVSFIGVESFGSDGAPTMTYFYFNGTGVNNYTTVTPASLNSTNYGPFTRFF